MPKAISGLPIHGIVWRAGIPDMDGDIITTDALREAYNDLRMRIGQQVGDVSVLFNFDYRKPVGRIVEVQWDGENLIARVIIDKKETIGPDLWEQCALRPGFVVEKQEKRGDGTQVFKKISHFSISLTDNPMPLPTTEEERREETPGS